MGLKGIAVVCAIIALFCFGILSITDFDGRVEWVSEYYDLYHVNAPFGEFWVDIEGQFIFGCGRITSEFKEAYVAKYFKDGYLLTLNLDAEKTPVAPDGIFCLEIQRKSIWLRYWYESESHVELYQKPFDKDYIRYVIHVPALPSVNQTLQWEIVG